MLSLGLEGALASDNTDTAFYGEALFLFQESPFFRNKMLVEPIFKTLPVHPCSFLVVKMDRNAVCFSILV
jgi:hypothetical protein